MSSKQIWRRELLGVIGAAAAWPLAAHAQQPGKAPTVGLLVGSSAATSSAWVAAFVQRLRELGWVEGSNIEIEYRWAEGRSERAAEVAAEFVTRKVDVIVVGGTPATMAVKQATTVIPIVFVGPANPLGSGLVASLARPGGNLTGLSNQATDIAGKRLGLLREVLPDLRRLAILNNIGSEVGVQEIGEVQAAARALGIDAAVLEVRRSDDIAPAFEGLNGRAQALYVGTDPLMNTDRVRINTFALVARLPTTHGFRENVEAGGLMSYGANLTDLFRRAGDYVDKILRGTKPADIPVEQPTRFDLVLNLITARALRLEIPATVLALANEVIE